MNNGAFGENFPYSNFHDLNTDWIVKIAKDFLDQYTHIQEVIANGEQSLQDLTTSGLEQLQDKADALEALLQQWYDTHSQDIANQLADALADLNNWYTEHQNLISQQLTNAVTSFNSQAEQKAREVIGTIPDDYTAVTTKLDNLMRDALSWYTFYQTSRTINLLNPETNIPNRELSVSDGSITHSQYANYVVSDIIPIPSGVPTLYITRATTATERGRFSMRVCFYDQDYNFISGTSTSTATVPTGAKFCRVWDYNTYINSGYKPMVSIVDAELTAEAFTKYQNLIQFITTQLSTVIAETHLSLTQNILNLKTIQANRGLSASGIVIPQTANYTSEFIPIKPNTTYYYTRAATATTRMAMSITRVCYYDNTLALISSAEGVTSHTSPANASFMRVSINQFGLQGYQPMIADSATAPYTGYLNMTDVLTNDRNIICIGDSLTWGSGGSGSDPGYRQDLQQLTGKIVERFALPGAPSNEIAGAIGGMPLWVEPVTIPASGSVQITLTVYNNATLAPFLFPSIDSLSVNPVWIDGIEGTLDLSGESNHSKVFTFTRKTAGTSHKTYIRTPLRTAGATRLNSIPVIWIGTNQGYSDTQDLVDQIRSIVNVCNHDQYIVIGLTVRYSEDRERDMLNAFGNHYIDMLYALTTGGLEMEGITATAQDLIDIENHVVPTSLRSDSTHLNQKGYHAVAKIIYQRGIMLQYWN